MPEPVGVDMSALRVLTDRIARAADELAAVSIPGVEELPGSVLATLASPRRAAADVRRLGDVIQGWVAAARRSADELVAADRAHADRVGPT